MLKNAIKTIWISLLVVGIFISPWSSAHIHLPQDHNHHGLQAPQDFHDDAFQDIESSHSHELEHHSHAPVDHLLNFDGNHSSNHVIVLDHECVFSQGQLIKLVAILPQQDLFKDRWNASNYYFFENRILSAEYPSRKNVLPPERAPPA